MSRFFFNISMLVMRFKSRIKIQFVWLFFLFAGTHSIASELDSLLGVWQNKQASDSIRITAGLNYSSRANQPDQYDKAIAICNEIMAIQKNETVSDFYLNAQRIQIEKTHLKNGTDQLEDFEAIYQKALADKKPEAIAFWSYAIAHYHQVRDNYPTSITHWLVSIQHYEKLGNKKRLGYIHQNLSFVFGQIGDTIKLVEEGELALSIYKDLNDTVRMIDMSARMAETYATLGDVETSKARIEFAENLANLYGDQEMINFCRSPRSEYWKACGEYEKAQEAIYGGLQYNLKANENQRAISFYYAMMADILVLQAKYREALKYGQLGLEVARTYELVKEEGDNLIPLHQAYLALGDYKNAFEILERKAFIEKEMRGSKKLLDITNQLNQFEQEKQAYTDSIQKANQLLIREMEHENDLAEKRNQKYLAGAGIVLMLIIAILLVFESRRARRDNRVLSLQKLTVEEQKKEIVDSIQYAKRIQRAILPSDELIQKNLPDSFLLYKPKDIVAGDFYWMIQDQANLYFAAADCTGHGVPGAMVSVVCNGALNRSVKEFQETEPGKILDRTRTLVIEEFEKSDAGVNDGMDVSLIAIQSDSECGEQRIKWAGANNALWIIKKDSTELEEIKPDKQPIGKYSNPKPFTTHSIQLNAGDTCYLFTDGFQDQFGGEKGKKFKASNLKSLLVSIQTKSMSEQKQVIEEAFESWRGALEQIDDVCIWGFRV